MEEWDLYDGEGNPVGQRIFRGEPIPPGLHYLAAEVWITDGKGRLLVQQRSPYKKICPGRWGMTTGCMTAGEDSRQGMERELWEELGIRVLPDELELKTRFVREDAIWDVYLLRRPIPLEELRLQKEEVSQAAWMTPEEILRLAREGKAVSYPEFFDLLEKARQDWID